MHLFRIAQEALNNAIKHADSRRIEVGLRSTPGKVSLSVADDGVGMKRSPRHRTGRGLSIMHYRAGLIGGSLTMLRRKGGGTVVHCVVPVAPAPKSIRTHPARPPKHRLGR